MSLPKIAIIAAHPGELRPLVRGWAKSSVNSHGTRLRIYREGRAFAVCGGMGAEAVGSAARALVAHAHPDLLISAGWAGSLRPELHVGDIVVPELVMDAVDGRAFRAFCGAGTLLTASGVLGADDKASLATRYAAHGIDMEAATVGEVAQETATRFLAVKSIFDEHDFALPPLTRFIGRRGKFRYASFITWLTLRPRLWPVVRNMERNSRRSAQTLASFLEKLVGCDSLVEVQQQVARLALGIPL